MRCAVLFRSFPIADGGEVSFLILLFRERFSDREVLPVCSESPSRSDLERFLANLPGYRERLSRFRLDPAEQEETLLRIVKQVAEVPAVALV